MGDNQNILAGTGAAGADGTGLVWMAIVGSTAPTDAPTALAAAWKNMGMTTEDGATIKQNVSSTKYKVYGSTATQRTLVTDEETTVDLVFAETNEYTQAVYWRKALTSITPTAVTGAFSVTAGTFSRQLYAMVIDMIDGVNRMRFYFPQVEVTSQADLKISNSAVLEWGVTLSAYPNTSGVSVQVFEAIPALG